MHWPLDALLVAAVPLLALFPLHNNDLWWHLAAGRWIVEHHAVPRTDVFSWTHFLGAWVKGFISTDQLTTDVFAAWKQMRKSILLGDRAAQVLAVDEA